VVGVGVRVENSVEAIDLLAEGLLAKIGRGVDDDVAAVIRKQNRGPSPFIARIGRAAHFAMTGESRDAHGSAGAEDGEAENVWRGGRGSFSGRHYRAPLAPSRMDFAAALEISI
jgi:hypothetical protein